MNVLRLAVVMIFGVPCIVLAEGVGKFECTKDDLVRRVEIYTEPGTTVPCEVHYFKDTEAPGESQVLWRANADAGYCESKTREFIAELERWGWTCNTSAIELPSPDDDGDELPTDPGPEIEDDTDVLSPGDPRG